MKCREIIRILEEKYPPSCAEEWDNPGLLLGRAEKDVRKILVALDVTDQAVERALEWGADLIVSHHPLIFKGIRQINDGNFLGRRILTLAEHGIACYAMHTNFDVRGMADLNEKQLNLKNTEVLLKTGENQGKPQGIGRIGDLPEPMDPMQLAGYVKQQLKLPAVRCYGKSGEKLVRAAVSGGSGKSVVDVAVAAGARALITGDIDYHTAIDALAQGLVIIDAGHYGTESVFIESVARELSVLLPECRTAAMEIEQPFTVI